MANTVTRVRQRPLDDSEMRPGAPTSRPADLTTALETALSGHGLTLGDYQVLVYLSEAPDRRMRMCDLAVRLQLSPSGLTRRLDGLVRNGFVVRVGSDDDRRVMLAVLTDSGAGQLETAAPTTSPACAARDRPSRRGRVVALGRICSRRSAPRSTPAARRRATDSVTALPAGFAAHVANVGIKDDTDDFVVVAADVDRAPPRRVHRSRFAGPSVVVSREHLADGARPSDRRRLQERQRRHRAGGLARRPRSCERRRRAPRLRADDVLVASTGVIGRPYPMDRIRAGIAALAASVRRDADDRPRRPRHHDHRHRRQGRRGDGRPDRGPGRRHRQGRRDDRARHGDDDHA